MNVTKTVRAFRGGRGQGGKNELEHLPEQDRVHKCQTMRGKERRKKALVLQWTSNCC